jgi:hypothetical protein
MAWDPKNRLDLEKRFDLKTRLDLRLAMAGAVLAAGLFSVVTAAQMGVVHLGAGEMGISLGRSETGLTMNIASRSCPPHCGIDINWRPLAR